MSLPTNTWIRLIDGFPKEGEYVLCDMPSYGNVLLRWDDMYQLWYTKEGSYFYPNDVAKYMHVKSDDTEPFTKEELNTFDKITAFFCHKQLDILTNEEIEKYAELRQKIQVQLLLT